MSRRHARRRRTPVGRQVHSRECVEGTAPYPTTFTPPGATVGTMTRQRRRAREREEQGAAERLTRANAADARWRARYSDGRPR